MSDVCDHRHRELRIDLDAVRLRRERLRERSDALDAALGESAVAGDRDGYERVAVVLAELTSEVRHHVEATESEGAMFDEVVLLAPRLSRAVDRLRCEHRRIEAALEQLAESIVGDGEQVDVRAEATDLVQTLANHRRHGADLLHDAFWVDVGGPDG